MLQSSEQRAKSSMAHKWVDWLHNPSSLGVPNAPKWRTNSVVAHKCERWLYKPGHLGVTNAAERGTKPVVAHKWVDWLHNPCCPGGPQCFSAGQNQQWPTSGKIGNTTLADEGGGGGNP